MTLRRAILLLVVMVLVSGAGSWWWLWHTTSGSRFLWTRAEALSGGSLQLKSLDGSLADGLQLKEVRFDADTVRVAIGSLSANVDVAVLPLRVTVSKVRATGIRVDVLGGGDDEQEFDIASLLETMALPFGLVVADLQAENADINIQSLNFTRRIDQFTLSGRWFDQIIIDELIIEAQDDRLAGAGALHLVAPQEYRFDTDLTTTLPAVSRIEQLHAKATVQGVLDTYRYDVTAQARVAGAGTLDSVVNGTGTFNSLRIDSLRTAGEGLALHANGDIGWTDGLRLSGMLEVEDADLHQWIDGWPARHAVYGSATIDFDAGRIEVGKLALFAKESSVAINGDARIDFDSADVTANLGWSDLRWPMGPDNAQVTSTAGRVQVSGTLDAWTLDGEFDLAAAGVDDGRFSVTGGGNRDRVNARITEGRVLGGRVAGDISASWRQRRPWSAKLALAGVRPQSVWPDSAWAGQLSGRIDAQGEAAPVSARIRLRDVNGQFMGRPLTANGDLDFAADTLTARNFRLQHGSSELLLNGSLESPRGVVFSADIERLELYQERVQGDLYASGTLKMVDQQPTLELRTHSGQLAVANTEFRDVDLVLDSSGLEQALRIDAHLDEFTATLELGGTLEDWGPPYDWHGRLQKFEIQGADRRMVHLIGPVEVAIAASGARVGRMCFEGAYDSNVCAQADWAANRSLELLADIEALPINHINQFVETGYVFDQLVTGKVQWHFRAGQPMSGLADITLSPGNIKSSVREDFALATGAGQIALNVHDGVLLDGKLLLPLPGTGVIDGEFAVSDVVHFRDSEVSGQLQVIANDIGFLRVFTPLVDSAAGRMSANIALSGTVSSPLVEGDLSLDNASVSYQPLGLKLDDIQITSTFDKQRRFELQGTFRAGQGHGRLSSRGDYKSSMDSGVEVEIRGENLTLVDVPDVQTIADADLRVGFDEGSLRINGKIMIPRARLSPSKLPSTRYAESDDVVIVAGDLPDQAQEPERNAFKINGDLEVGLGNDVVIDLDIAKATVSGTTHFKWQDSLIPIANGRYDIAGDVEAYGQVLQISEGALRFPKVPANNPNLRIRAEREIFGNSQIKRAGILIAGTVKRPTVEAYTEPGTTEERALTLLVTGSDFNFEQGVGAIDFGTYIAPKLFVSYGVGLFDRENVISARYDLGKGFGVKATSGQKESGVDLIYRIER